MSHAMHSGRMGHGEEFWQNVVHWRSDWQTALVFFLRTQWAVWRDKKIRHWKMNLPRSVGVQYATGEEHRNSCRKNEEAEPEQVRCPVVDVSGGESNVWCSKEQYCIGTWNVRSISQSKLDMVKQEMVRVSINILDISEIKWMGMGEFNLDDHYVYYWGKESVRRNGVILIVNKNPKCSHGCNLKNNRMILVHFQDKRFSITIIQVYAPIINAKEAEVEWFYKDLPELAPYKMCFSS